MGKHLQTRRYAAARVVQSRCGSRRGRAGRRQTDFFLFERDLGGTAAEHVGHTRVQCRATGIARACTSRRLQDGSMAMT